VVNYFLKTTGKIMVPRFFNRLDMNTSGLIIVAKNSYAQSFLQEKGTVNKFYKAIVKGIVEKDEFLIDRPIGKVGEKILIITSSFSLINLTLCMIESFIK
jgi:23S rRNA pseudouridine1911/1915/1917 synthase